MFAVFFVPISFPEKRTNIVVAFLFFQGPVLVSPFFSAVATKQDWDIFSSLILCAAAAAAPF